ncbi:MAG: GFA family protein [Caulobacterales bacterium]
MSGEHTGSCLCGEVRFEILGAFDGFFLCHCSRCRKGSGSAHGANLFSTTATLNWLSGEDMVKTFDVEGTRHRRSFCNTCGSPLPRFHKNGWLVAPAGGFDSAIEKRPDAHIFTGSRANWDHLLEDVPAFEEFPGQ